MELSLDKNLGRGQNFYWFGLRTTESARIETNKQTKISGIVIYIYIYIAFVNGNSSKVNWKTEKEGENI